MSCLGRHYLPTPPREWYRFDNVPPNKDLFGQRYTKGNILQYKANSSNMTAKERYSRIARGTWINHNTTWATQTQSTTNPNTGQLERIGFASVKVPTLSIDNNKKNNNDMVLPLNWSSSTVAQGVIIPFRNNNVNNSDNVIMPPIRTPTISPLFVEELNGGILLCGTLQNPVTMAIQKPAIPFNPDICNLSTSSDVPGPATILCWREDIETWYPRQKRTYGTSGNKWPTNSKFIRLAQ